VRGGLSLPSSSFLRMALVAAGPLVTEPVLFPIGSFVRCVDEELMIEPEIGGYRWKSSKTKVLEHFKTNLGVVVDSFIEKWYSGKKTHTSVVYGVRGVSTVYDEPTQRYKHEMKHRHAFWVDDGHLLLQMVPEKDIVTNDFPITQLPVPVLARVFAIIPLAVAVRQCLACKLFLRAFLDNVSWKERVAHRSVKDATVLDSDLILWLVYTRGSQVMEITKFVFVAQERSLSTSLCVSNPCRDYL
jgi:hypothetical protein